MKFNPMTDEQIEALNPKLSPGQAQFTIKNAENAIAKKSGNKMIKLTLLAIDAAGTTGIIIDYLLFTPEMMWKTKHCCECVGITKQYEIGELEPSHFQDKEGAAVTREEKAKDGYGAQIKIQDYCKPEVAAQLKEDELNDDLPF